MVQYLYLPIGKYDETNKGGDIPTYIAYLFSEDSSSTVFNLGQGLCTSIGI